MADTRDRMHRWFACAVCSRVFAMKLESGLSRIKMRVPGGLSAVQGMNASNNRASPAFSPAYVQGDVVIRELRRYANGLVECISCGTSVHLLW